MKLISQKWKQTVLATACALSFFLPIPPICSRRKNKNTRYFVPCITEHGGNYYTTVRRLACVLSNKENKYNRFAQALQAEAGCEAGDDESGVALLHAVLHQLLLTHASQRLLIEDRREKHHGGDGVCGGGGRAGGC